MLLFKISRAVANIEVFSANLTFVRTMFECGEKESRCKTNKCKKKFGPCPTLPKIVPEKTKEWASATHGLNFYGANNASIKPVPPFAPPDLTFCKKVPKLSGETLLSERKSAKCCITSKTKDPTKCNFKRQE